jgi:hypothetical protein
VPAPKDPLAPLREALDEALARWEDRPDTAGVFPWGLPAALPMPARQGGPGAVMNDYCNRCTSAYPEECAKQCPYRDAPPRLLPLYCCRMPERVYIVRGKVAKDALNTIKKGDTVWPGWTNEAGGWHQWDQGGPARVKRFSSEEEARGVALKCHGPWYSNPDPESIEILEAFYCPPQGQVKQQGGRNLAGTRRSIEHEGVIVVVSNRQTNRAAHHRQGIDPCCGVRLRGFVISGRERDSATDHSGRNDQRKDELFHGPAPIWQAKDSRPGANQSVM